MVTLIESQFFGYFNSVFVFLAVMIIIFGILSTMKLFGEHSSFFNAIIAVALGVVFASSSFASRTFELATPWLVMLFVLFVFLQMAVKFMEAEEVLNLGKNVPIMTIMLITIVMIFAVSAAQAGRERKVLLIDQGELQEGEVPVQTLASKIGETIRHPSVLGIILVLMVATFALMLLARKE